MTQLRFDSSATFVVVRLKYFNSLLEKNGNLLLLRALGQYTEDLLQMPWQIAFDSNAEILAGSDNQIEFSLTHFARGTTEHQLKATVISYIYAHVDRFGNVNRLTFTMHSQG